MVDEVVRTRVATIVNWLHKLPPEHKGDKIDQSRNYILSSRLLQTNGDAMVPLCRNDTWFRSAGMTLCPLHLFQRSTPLAKHHIPSYFMSSLSCKSFNQRL